MSGQGSSSSSSKPENQTLFSRLRRLAVDIEQVIQVTQTALESKKSVGSDSDNSAQAINFLHHSKVDMIALREKVEKQLVDFTLRNLTMDRIQDLMKSVLTVVGGRLENVEGHMEKYGYARPAPAHNDEVSGTANVNDLPNDVKESEEDKTNDQAGDEDFDESPKTPPPQADSAKPGDQKTLRTPRIEDLYRHLSEHTIMLLKQGPAKKVQPENVNVSSAYPQNPSSFMFPPSSTSSLSSSLYRSGNGRPQTPELPVLQTLDLNSYVFPTKHEPSWNTTSASANSAAVSAPEPPKLFSSNTMDICSVELCGISASKTREGKFIKRPESPTLLTPASKLDCFSYHNTEKQSTVCEGKVFKRPESPTLLTPGLKLDCFADHNTERQSTKSARALFTTPPMPELKTCVLKGYNASVADCDTGTQHIEAVVNSRARISTPEPPKLLTCSINYEKYLDKK